MDSLNKFIFIFILYIIFTPLSSCQNNPPTVSQNDEGLFFISQKTGTLPENEDGTKMRTRYAEINFEQLDNAEAGDEITLNLFTDAVYEFVVDSKVSNNDGNYSLVGHIKDVENSNVTFVVGGGQLAGNITLPGEIYQVRFAGEDAHAIHQIDQSGFPPEAEPITTE
jgi:hypothetical protein